MYSPHKKYDIVIFQKAFAPQYFDLAQRLKAYGTKIVLDLNVNYLDTKSNIIKPGQPEQAKKFIQLTDYVLTTTEFIAQQIKKEFPEKPVVTIPENIETFGKQKQSLSFAKDQIIRLVHVGHAVKLGDLQLIADPLKELADQYPIEILILSDHKTSVKFEHSQIFVKVKLFDRFNQKAIFDDLMWGDIFIAPRDLSETYNLGHSFDKIGRPMAVGVPVIASPVPSYKGSPAILLDSFGSEWSEQIRAVLTDEKKYWSLSQEGISYYQEHFIPAVVMKQYGVFFDTIMASS
jgi:glycosyltransferase involved in cell wall biosynthesis